MLESDHCDTPRGRNASRNGAIPLMMNVETLGLAEAACVAEGCAQRRPIQMAPSKRVLGVATALGMALLPFAVQAEMQSIEVDGLASTAWFESAGDDAPLVMMLHGTLGHARMETLAGIQAALAERGLSSLSINLSYGIDGREGLFECDAPVTHGLEQHFAEIDGWRDWAREQGHDITAWFGHSRGGNQIARWAFERDEAAPLLLLAPSTSDFDAAGAAYDARSDTPRDDLLAEAEARIAAGDGATVMGEHPFLYCESLPISAQAFASYYGNDPFADTPTLLSETAPEQPVLVWIGSLDDVVEDLPDRLEQVRAAGGLERVETQTIDGADHFFRDFFAEDVADSAIEFLGR